MTRRLSRKTIHEWADINAEAIHCTYFPYPEYTTKRAYSCGVYGCTGVLLVGETSGCLYEADPYANENGTPPYGFIEAMGNRERAIVEKLRAVQEIEHDGTRASTVAFIACDGSRFTAHTNDYGHTWTICG